MLDNFNMQKCVLGIYNSLASGELVLLFKG
jgi:hypothetical protein